MLKAYSAKEIESLLRTKPAKKIMVFGDLILDSYQFGKVERISQEAPIQILGIEKQEYCLGGAACVANDLVHLGNQVACMGLVGQDSHQGVFKDLLESAAIDTQHLIEKQDFTTILKVRFLAARQQILRVDYEKPYSLAATDIEQILAKIFPLLDAKLYDALVISDYGKGFCHPELIKKIIQRARQNAIPCVVDPKNKDYRIYQHCTTIKPNRAELSQATGLRTDSFEAVVEAAGKLQEMLAADFLSISLDKDGILYYVNPKLYHLFPTKKQEVFDVSGAGDVVTAVLATGLANNWEPSLILHLANIAAGIEISKLGALPVSLQEIYDSLEPSYRKKIVSLEQFLALPHDPETVIALSYGYFDQISTGHVKFIQAMESLGNLRVLAINSDASIIKHKGRTPTLNEQERAELFSAFSSIDWVIIFPDQDASSLIEKIRPSIVVKGDNFKHQTLPEAGAIEKVQAELVFLPKFE